MQNPNYYEPWRVDDQVNVSGSGCILPGHRILTNAHVVSNEIFIQVLKDGDSRKYTAQKLFVAHDCDLAVLKVEDPAFFEGTLPVTFGGLPFLKDKVSVYGYPVGGEELSITAGVVSRIEIVPYSHSFCNLLGIQTDAAINPGNSGGPAFENGRLVGVAFQGYNAIMAQNTGYLIPMVLIHRFMDEIKAGKYHPVPSMGTFTQPLENDDIRAYYGLKKGQTGVLVSTVVYGSSAYGILQEKDVLLSISGYPIANDGTIPFRAGERLNFRYPLCSRKPGDPLPLGILRGGKPMAVTLSLKDDARLVSSLAYDVPPTYFIFDGLVFTPLTLNYMRTKDGSDFNAYYYEGLPTPNRKQVVLISHILSHEINKGYGSSCTNGIVRSVNGHPISEMKDLLKAFEDPKDGRHVIETGDDPDSEMKIVLDASKSKQATAEILSLNHISSDRSEDLK
jgi:S1-C subfamily serine protease